MRVQGSNLRIRATSFKGVTISDTLAWLLDPGQPSIRYLALKELLDLNERDTQVREAKESIRKRGWAAEIMERRSSGGWWVSGKSLYFPKYLSTNWMLLVLSDLGLTKEDVKIRSSCELWMKKFAKKDGGFGTDEDESSELCLVGNTARALVKFGYADHTLVRSAFEWLVRNQKENGGWHCWGRNGVIDAWEGMSAFAVYPRQKWSRSMKNAVERGAEFYLKRKLHRQGALYEPWYRFHYPVHYYYDILVGLDFITALGFGDDPRLKEALNHLKGKMRKDGRLILDAVHPDYDNAGKWPAWWEKYKRSFHPFSLEHVGQPSKMMTLRAMTILKRVQK
jgi:hypothetical protein